MKGAPIPEWLRCSREQHIPRKKWSRERPMSGAVGNLGAQGRSSCRLVAGDGDPQGDQTSSFLGS